MSVLPTRDPRVRSFLDPPSFFPSPRPFFLFSRSAFYAPRKSGERAPVSLPPSPSSLPLFFFFLPSTPLRFHSVFPSAWRDSRLTYNKHTHSGGGEGGGSLVGCQPQKRNKTALLAASTVENRDQERERESRLLDGRNRFTKKFDSPHCECEEGSYRSISTR